MQRFFKFSPTTTTYFYNIDHRNPITPTSIIDSLSGGHLAWMVLVYTMFNNAMVIPWMISIGADKFLRLAWRHMLLGPILIPFIMY